MSSNSSPSKDRNSTQEWLESILEGYYATKHPDKEDGLEVIDWNISPVEGEGYLSEMLSLDVQYAVGRETQRAYLVAKLLPQDPYNRAFVIQTQFDLREIRFYTEIRPALEDVLRHRLDPKDFQPLPVPDYFHAVYKEDSESILVMEDLRKKGFEHQDLNKGLTLRQAEAAVDCLAHLHSASLALQIDCGDDLDKRFPYLLSKEKAEEAFHTLFEKGLPLLLKFIQKQPKLASLGNCLQDYAGNRSKDIFQRVLSPSDKVNTLIHGDFWSNNLLFKIINNTTTCSVIDWQMIMRGSPSVDLGMLITTSLSPMGRHDHEEAIVNAYWKSFTSKLHTLGVKDKELNYTLEDLKTDLKDGKLFGVLVMIGSVDIALGDPEREDRVISLISDLINDGIL